MPAHHIQTGTTFFGKAHDCGTGRRPRHVIEPLEFDLHDRALTLHLDGATAKDPVSMLTLHLSADIDDHVDMIVDMDHACTPGWLDDNGVPADEVWGAVRDFAAQDTAIVGFSWTRLTRSGEAGPRHVQRLTT